MKVDAIFKEIKELKINQTDLAKSVQFGRDKIDDFLHKIRHSQFAKEHNIIRNGSPNDKN